MYLNGRGIAEKTAKLSNRLMLRGLVSYVVFGAASWIAIVSPFATEWSRSWPALTGLAVVCFIPWIAAATQLARHTAQLKRETKSRSKGWGDS